MQAQQQHGQGGNNNNIPVGGQGNPASQNTPLTTQQASAELTSALQAFQAAIDSMPASPTRNSVVTKCAEARAQLENMSQANLLEAMKEQAKNLEAEIKLLVSTEDKVIKKAINQALHNLNVAYQNYAQARLVELSQNQPNIDEMSQHIASRQFKATDGTDFNTHPNDFGKKFDQIKGVNPFTGKEVIVQFQNGLYTSESPEDLAYIVKSRGHTKFTFTDAKSGKSLIHAMRAMLKVGIETIEVDEKLVQRLKATMLNPMDHVRLEQLLRIAAASSSAAHSVGKNDVFKDKDAQLHTGVTRLKEHEVETFIRISEPADQLAYLQILYPDKATAAKKYAEFTVKLQKHAIKPTSGTQIVRHYEPMLDNAGQPIIDPATQQPMMNPDVYTDREEFQSFEPEDYFKEKLLNRGIMSNKGIPTPSRQKLKTEYHREMKKLSFDSQSTTPAQRQAAYLAARHDEKLMAMYAQSTSLQVNDINNLITAVFDDKQVGANKHTISLHKNFITQHHSVRSSNEKSFLNSMVPLFAKIASPADQSAALEGLRDRALTQLNLALNQNDPAVRKSAMQDFFKNKTLLDKLESTILNTLAHRDQAKVLFNNNLDNAALYFITHLSSATQQELAQTTATLSVPERANILNVLIEMVIDTRSSVATQMLTAHVPTLMTNLTPVEQSELTGLVNDNISVLMHSKNVHGTDATQNRILKPLREALKDEFPAAARKLSTVALFSEHYNTAPDSLQDHQAKLDARISAYAAEMPAKPTSVNDASKQLGNLLNLSNIKAQFKSEMHDLLFPNNADNLEIDDMLNYLDTNHSNNSNKMTLIQILRDLQPRPMHDIALNSMSADEGEPLLTF